MQIASGINNFTLSTKDLLLANQGFHFSDLIKALSEQERRRKKLISLHQKLAEAYCGKNGAEEAKTYCETLMAEDHLNRKTVASLLGHITEYANFIKKSNDTLSKQFSDFTSELHELIQQPYVGSELIDIMEKRTETLIKAIDKGTSESQDQAELLEYLRRVVTEFVQAKDEMLSGFEPCPPAEKSNTIGIMCLIQEFDDIKDTLRNKSIFTLGEILKIRSNYDTFLKSISTFLTLLEEFHAFYTSSSKDLISLEDNYFIEQYSNVKSTHL